MKGRKMGMVVLVATILGIIVAMAWQEWKETFKSKTEEKPLNEIPKVEEIDEPEVLQIQAPIYPKEEILSEYRGYTTLAKLEIPSIKLETYILAKCTKASLNKSVAKFWGVNPNEVGNCCVAGHNAPRNKNMFYHLKNLEVGEELTVIDKEVGKVPYEIYDKYTVIPEDISPLDEETRW